MENFKVSLLRDHAPNCAAMMGKVCSCGTEELIQQILKGNPMQPAFEDLLPQELEVLQKKIRQQFR